jgi:tetratricopeptide (TPR) repeat protein
LEKNLFDFIKSWLARRSSQEFIPPVDPRRMLLVSAFEQFQTGQLSAAEKSVLDAMAMTTADSEESLTDYGLILLHNIWMDGDSHPKAVEFYTSYMQEHPDSLLPYKLRAEHYWYNAESERALEDFSRVLEFDSQDSGNLLGRGQVFVELGKPNEALQDLEQALKILNQVPNNRVPHWSEAQAYTRNGLGAAAALLGDFSRAFQEYELSISLQPENGWVYFNRAQTFEKVGDSSNALADYKKAIDSQKPKLTPYKRALAESRIRELTP